MNILREVIVESILSSSTTSPIHNIWFLNNHKHVSGNLNEGVLHSGVEMDMLDFFISLVHRS